jgi:Chromo (CHRromatin Organisation MOdifier) domain
MGRVMCTTAEDLALLHQRLGHASWGRLLKMCRAGTTAGIGSIESMPAAELQRAEKIIKECTACTEGKQHRNALGRGGLDKGTEAGEVLHMDTFYVTLRDPRTNSKYRQYCLLATDSFTEQRWMATTNTLRDLQEEAISVMRSSRTQSGRRPRLVVTDLGSEFENNKVANYCTNRGIHLQPTPARAKELNGVSEKSVDTVKNHVRAILIASKVPDQMGWARATAHHVFIWNRTHVGRHTGMTPHQAATGREPSILNVGVFGCDAFVHQDRTQRDTTFSPKAEPGIYLGHDSRQNCPVVRMLHTGKTVRVKDALFREGSFRHMRAELEGSADQVGQLDLSVMTEFDAMISEESGRRCHPAQLPPPADTNESDESDDDPHPLDHEEKYSEPEPLQIADSKRRYRVKSITDKRTTTSGQEEYRVKWVGHSTSTWEPADTIEEDAPDAVKDYTTFVERRSEARVTRNRAKAKAADAAAPDRESGDKSKSDSTSTMAAARFAAAQCL